MKDSLKLVIEAVKALETNLIDENTLKNIIFN